ncbi:hypothetical protein LIPSTDRAFT_71039 [Lipomyces starkeyi NRRL Y-11557]|uniref:Uncharacterized protein n=1 Tax=Lipomyces starkeyi NRRL Y-11557 TaxID=675824 RepID=A0A1E3Q8M0_LIPST|nr:hypothetical protein LIPSTDRAFT_71039 [Lipomyces starkeyi NRRL Y-11557]
MENGVVGQDGSGSTAREIGYLGIVPSNCFSLALAEWKNARFVLENDNRLGDM